ncbi:MAG TPA: hypothetical protein VE871_16680 [Longimicrobium sp.]|nr:hypothetical protein [Longimicrobium sp.]
MAEPSIFVQHPGRQAPLAAIAPRTLQTDAEFANALNEVVAVLISNADQDLDAARAWTAS